MTRRVALLGKPLKRRHSQVMHDAAFDAAGIDGRYVLRELEPDEVEGAVADARGPDWFGLGVTAPYKKVVAGMCDEVEADAATIGAVNNVVRTDGLFEPEFMQAVRAADLAVNATTVGMLDPGMTIPVDALRDDATVFDLVYVPAETELLRTARSRGLRAANGSEMLIAQAAAAFERWTGVRGMAGVMREAVAPLLADPTVRA